MKLRRTDSQTFRMGNFQGDDTFEDVSKVTNVEETGKQQHSKIQ